MKKTILTFAVITLTLLVLSTSAFAYGGGFGPGSNGSCLREELTPEQQSRFDAVIENFRARMTELREKIFAARESGDSEAFAEAREERDQLMLEKQEQLGEIFPEAANRFSQCGRGMRNYGSSQGANGLQR